MELRFTPRYEGKILSDLAVIHEHVLHLIIVSEDLEFFDHVHPVPQPQGSLTLEYRFVNPGRYVLYSDLTPRGGRSQVFRQEVVVGPAGPPRRVHLAASPAAGRTVGAYQVQLLPQPRTPRAGTEVQLIFRLAHNARPVNDLEPYIGALGHCVILSEDTQRYLHSHPQMFRPITPATRGGPEVAFHTVFPAPGRYKVWGQFRRGREVIVADFVLEVRPALLPAAVERWILGD